MGKTIDQIEQMLANKSANYWAKMRTNNILMHRGNVDDQVIDEFRKELGLILDSGILTYPHTLEQNGITEGMTLEERKAKFGVEKKPFTRTEEEEKLLYDLANKAHNIRKTNWAFRIAQEAEEKHELGWYPFFITLTVDPAKAQAAGTSSEEIWREGREFRKYIRALADVVTEELGEKPCRKYPYRPESNYVTYAAVVEHGKSRSHHHCHIIAWLRAIPANWRVCPNKGIKHPENRVYNECKPMRDLWEWSRADLSPAKYFRTVGDIWEKRHSFSLPWDEKRNKPMNVSKPGTTGNYLMKYLTKEFKQWNHRVKATRNLGMVKLRNQIKEMSLETAEALSWRAENAKLNHSLMMIHGAPLGLVRQLAKRRVYLIKFKQRQLDLSTLMTSNSGVFTRMLRSVRAGVRPDRMDSMRFFDWLGELLPEEKGYSRYRQIAAHTALAEAFPREIKQEHVKSNWRMK